MPEIVALFFLVLTLPGTTEPITIRVPMSLADCIKVAPSQEH